MKKFLVTLVLFGSLQVVAAFAKDKEAKPEIAPEFSVEQQAEIFKLQVDMADELLQAQPHNIAVQNIRQRIQEKINSVCDPTKYQVDWRSLKCTVLVKPVEAPKPEEKPAEQK